MKLENGPTWEGKNKPVREVRRLAYIPNKQPNGSLEREPEREAPSTTKDTGVILRKRFQRMAETSSRKLCGAFGYPGTDTAVVYFLVDDRTHQVHEHQDVLSAHHLMLFLQAASL